VTASSENVKIAVAIRSARTAIGWNQQEFADLMGTAKSTITRVETLEMGAKADFLNKAMRLFREVGVTVDLYQLDAISILVEPKAVLLAKSRLEDGSLKRSDRKKNPQRRVWGEEPQQKQFKGAVLLRPQRLAYSSYS
jgi:transcriptional regulator with XRE-family HTH domain